MGQKFFFFLKKKKKLSVPGVKRLMKEAQELRNPTDMYYAQPLDVSGILLLFLLRSGLTRSFGRLRNQ